MSIMFEGCSSLTSLTFPDAFDTSKVDNMDTMFYRCSKLEKLDLSKFSFNELTTCIGMFGNCDNLKELNLGDFVPPAGEASFAMFAKLNAEAGTISGSIPSIEKITMSGSCVLEPGEGTKLDDATGTFFDYKEPLPWYAYQQSSQNEVGEETLQATLVGFDEFKAYQATHPGLTTYYFNNQPTPPDPDPEPTPEPTLQDGWVEDDHGWRYVLNGEYLNDGWHYFEDEYGNHWYYFQENTYIKQAEWIWDADYNSWYWLCSTGPMIENLWQWIDNAWYGFWWGGKMCQGWVWDTYYQAWYYCYDSGVMALNTWVGPYWVNEHGMWVY